MAIVVVVHEQTHLRTEQFMNDQLTEFFGHSALVDTLLVHELDFERLFQVSQLLFDLFERVFNHVLAAYAQVQMRRCCLCNNFIVD